LTNYIYTNQFRHSYYMIILFYTVTYKYKNIFTIIQCVEL